MKHEKNDVIGVVVFKRDGESFDSLLKRFKRKCTKSDIFRDLKKHEEYVKPSVRRKMKHNEELRRRRKESEKAARLASKKIKKENWNEY